MLETPATPDISKSIKNPLKAIDNIETDSDL